MCIFIININFIDLFHIFFLCQLVSQGIRDASKGILANHPTAQHLTKMQEPVRIRLTATAKPKAMSKQLPSTPPKTNMEPKNWWFVDVSPFPRRFFQVPCLFSGVYLLVLPGWYIGLKSHHSPVARKRMTATYHSAPSLQNIAEEGIPLQGS